MPGAVRISDANSAGGVATGPGAPSVIINGRKACTNGASVTPHPCWPKAGCAPHASAKTANGNTSVLAEGIAMNAKGNSDTCGHGRATCSADVIIG